MQGPHFEHWRPWKASFWTFLVSGAPFWASTSWKGLTLSIDILEGSHFEQILVSEAHFSASTSCEAPFEHPHPARASFGPILVNEALFWASTSSRGLILTNIGLWGPILIIDDVHKKHKHPNAKKRPWEIPPPAKGGKRIPQSIICALQDRIGDLERVGGFDMKTKHCHIRCAVTWKILRNNVCPNQASMLSSSLPLACWTCGKIHLWMKARKGKRTKCE